MQSLQTWFDQYGESHRNPVNKTIHWICVPVIFFTIIGMLSCIPFHIGLFHAGTVALAAGLLFYLRLSWRMFIGMLLFSILILAGVYEVNLLFTQPVCLDLIVFGLAWVGQFIGHGIEGKKPSFLHDLQFLLIGPAWLMGFIYRRLGIVY